MRIEDVACRASGFVRPSFIDMTTGRVVPFGMRHNLLSFMSAEAMAAAFGGDTSYVPAKIGFIYGTESNPTEPVPSRDQSWQRLKSELSFGGENADVQVVGFSYHPTLGGFDPDGESSSGSSSSPGGDYNNILPTGSNAITFHAVSNDSDVGAIFGRSAFGADNYIYQAVLLGLDPDDDSMYHILSRVSLKDGVYLQKPEKFEVALDWTIVFK